MLLWVHNYQTAVKEMGYSETKLPMFSIPNSGVNLMLDKFDDRTRAVMSQWLANLIKVRFYPLLPPINLPMLQCLLPREAWLFSFCCSASATATAPFGGVIALLSTCRAGPEGGCEWAGGGQLPAKHHQQRAGDHVNGGGALHHDQ